MDQPDNDQNDVDQRKDDEPQLIDDMQEKDKEQQPCDEVPAVSDTRDANESKESDKDGMDYESLPEPVIESSLMIEEVMGDFAKEPASQETVTTSCEPICENENGPSTNPCEITNDDSPDFSASKETIVAQDSPQNRTQISDLDINEVTYTATLVQPEEGGDKIANEEATKENSTDNIACEQTKNDNNTESVCTDTQKTTINEFDSVEASQTGEKDIEQDVPSAIKDKKECGADVALEEEPRAFDLQVALHQSVVNNTELGDTPMDPEMEEVEYIVDRIMDKKESEKDPTKYLVKWQGYPMSANTWEPFECLVDCDMAMKGFEVNRAEKLAVKYRDVDESSDDTFYDTTGSPKEYKVESVQGLTEVDNQKYFLIKLVNSSEKAFIRASLANRLFPDKVIDFYLMHLRWKERPQ